MRCLSLVPLATVALVAAGCGSPSRNPEVGQVPRRDLTLQRAAVPQVEVASPVELARAVPVERRAAIHTRNTRRAFRSPAPTPPPSTAAIADVPVSTPTASSGAVPASPASYEAPDPYALAPGQTVTVLPAGNGAGAAPSPTNDAPPDAQRGESRGVTIRGGHGGSCGGRGGRGGGSPGFRGLR